MHKKKFEYWFSKILNHLVNKTDKIKIQNKRWLSLILLCSQICKISWSRILLYFFLRLLYHLMINSTWWLTLNFGWKLESFHNCEIDQIKKQSRDYTNIVPCSGLHHFSLFWKQRETNNLFLLHFTYYYFMLNIKLIFQVLV